MEGSGCVCHREQNCLGGTLSIESIKPLLKNIKGICADFHRSDKVHSHFVCSFSLRPYIKYYVVASGDFLDYASLGGSESNLYSATRCIRNPLGRYSPTN